ncbi:MAG: hypothetical protein LRY75_20380 [Shewanella xiamenensis]|nr:hypothetical protein [Shewanella xiamenensis]
MTPTSQEVSIPSSVDARPSDVNGFTNAAMAWMPKSGHGADGRLANHHDSPF